MGRTFQKCNYCGAPVSLKNSVLLENCNFCGQPINTRFNFINLGNSNNFISRGFLSLESFAIKITTSLKDKTLVLAKKQTILSQSQIETIFKYIDKISSSRRNRLLLIGVPLGLYIIATINDPYRKKYNQQWSENKEWYERRCRNESMEAGSEFLARKLYSDCFKEFRQEVKEDVKAEIEKEKMRKQKERIRNKEQRRQEKIRVKEQREQERKRIEKSRKAKAANDRWIAQRKKIAEQEKRLAKKDLRVNLKLEKKLTIQISKNKDNIYIQYKERADKRDEIAKANITLGKNSEGDGYRQLAINDYTTAIKLRPDYIDAYINRGLTKEASSDVIGACNDWAKAFSLGDKEVKEWLSQSCFSKYRRAAIEQLDKNNYQMAIKEFTKILSIWPKTDSILEERASTRLKLNDYKGAINDYTEAIEIKPSEHNYYISRANTKLKLKDYKGAMNDYTEAIEIKPSEHNYYISRAYTKLKLKDYDGAEEDYTKGIKIKPSKVTYYLLRGDLRIQVKSYDKALLDYNKVLELEQDNVIAYRERGLIKLNLKDENGYCKDIKKALSLGARNINKEQVKQYCQRLEILAKKQSKNVTLSENAKYYLDRIRPIYLKKSKCKETIRLINLLLPLYETDVIYSYRGKAQQLCSNFTESIKDYKSAIEINSEDSLYYSNLAKSKSKLKDFKGALEAYDLSIKLASKDSIYYRDRGMIKNQLGDYLGAISDFQTSKTTFRENCKSSGYYSNRSCKLTKEGRTFYKSSYESELNDEIGKIRIKLKDYVQAISSFDNSGSMESRLYRGIAKYELQDLDSACSDWYYYSKKRKVTGFLSYKVKYIADPDKLNSVKHNGSTIYSLYKKYCK